MSDPAACPLQKVSPQLPVTALETWCEPGRSDKVGDSAREGLRKLLISFSENRVLGFLWQAGTKDRTEADLATAFHQSWALVGVVKM